MFEPGAMARQHLLIEKRLEARSPRLRPSGKIEIHAASPGALSVSIETGLQIPDLTRFLDANRPYPSAGQALA
jgi:hypothetical protein